MKKLILLIVGSLIFATPAMAHRRYPNHPNYGKPHHHHKPVYIPKHNHCHYHRDGLWHCHRHTHGGPGYGHHGEKYLHGYWETEPKPFIEFHF